MREKLNNANVKSLLGFLLLSIFIFVFLATPVFIIDLDIIGYPLEASGYTVIEKFETKEDNGKTYLTNQKELIKEIEKTIKEYRDDGATEEDLEEEIDELKFFKSNVRMYNSLKTIEIFNSLFFVFIAIMLILSVAGILKDNSTLAKINKLLITCFVFSIFVTACVLTGSINGSKEFTYIVIGENISIAQTVGPCILTLTLLAFVGLVVSLFSKTLLSTKPKTYVPAAAASEQPVEPKVEPTEPVAEEPIVAEPIVENLEPEETKE